MSLRTSLVALGDEVRRLSGLTNEMTIDQMTTNLAAVTIPATQTYYTGTSEPAATLGEDGDLYFVTAG